jgi:hypothetical protein
MIFVCIKTDYKVRKRLTSDDQKPLLEQRVDHSFSFFDAWSRNSGGNFCKVSGEDDAEFRLYEATAHSLVDLAKLTDQFRDHTKLDIYVGVGNTEEDAEAAAEIAESKGLRHPLLMTEQLKQEEETTQAPDFKKFEIEVPYVPHVSSLEPLDKDLKSSLRNALKGAGIAAMIATRGHNPPPKLTVEQPKVEAPKAWEYGPPESLRDQFKYTVPAPDYPQQKVGETGMVSIRPMKVINPVKHPNPYYQNTWVERVDPTTATHGMHDGMWAIAQAESTGGQDMNHGKGFDPDTRKYKPEIHHVYVSNKHYDEGDPKEPRENRAFGVFGFRPYSAMDTYFNRLKGSKNPRAMDRMEGYHMSEKEFLNKFRTNFQFHAELVKQHIDDIKHKYRDAMEATQNPLVLFRAYHLGAQSKPEAVMVPNKYDELVLRGVKQGLDAGRDFDFTDMFGKDRFGKAMSDKLIQMAKEYKPVNIPRPSKTVKKKR